MTTLLSTMASFLHDAADSALLEVSVLPHIVLEGEYLLVNDAHGETIALACTTDPLSRPFDSLLRDKLRTVAARAQAPLILVCSWRTILAMHTDALIQRRPASAWIAGVWEGANVSYEDELAQSGKRAIITDALRSALTLSSARSTTWLDNVLNELVCTTHKVHPAEVVEVLTLCSVPMVLPQSPSSVTLLTDIVNAYVAEAHRRGTIGITSLPNMQPKPGQEQLFVALLLEILSVKNAGNGYQWQEDSVTQWLAKATGQPVPTIDAIDLALIAGGLDVTIERTSGSVHHPVRVIESGSSLGRIAKRLSLLNSKGVVEVHTDLAADAATMQNAIEKLSVLPGTTLILFAPMRVLRDRAYAGVRNALIHNLDVQWVMMSDADALTDPDQGICCIIAGAREHALPASLTTFAYLRTSLHTVVPPASGVDILEEHRIEALQQFVRYLKHGLRSKSNKEIAVRMVDRQTMLLHTVNNDAWEELLIPPDIIATILNKVLPHLQKLSSVGAIHNGMRTGANDVLIPRIDEIVQEELEEEFWQHESDHGVVDNVVVTSADELESVAGISASDRRLLLLPEDRTPFINTNINKRLTKAESNGIHQRTSLASKGTWWHLTAPTIPHLIICKNQGQRWLVAINASQAMITDVAIGVTLDNSGYTQQIALWLNSTLGMFFHLLLRKAGYQNDVTVRDVRELMVPTSEILDNVDTKKFRDFMYRPQQSIAEEFGSDDADKVRTDSIRRDRRRVDRMLMKDVFALTAEEQRWIYRLTVAWRSHASNLTFLGSALAMQLIVQHKIKPMREWYGPRIAQLPAGTTHTYIVPAHITRATYERGMFGWQLILWQNNKSDDAIDCTSESEAELMTLLINLGKRSVEVPKDELLLIEVLPLVRDFALDIEQVLVSVLTALPDDVHAEITNSIRSTLLADV